MNLLTDKVTLFGREIPLIVIPIAGGLLLFVLSKVLGGGSGGGSGDTPPTASPADTPPATGTVENTDTLNTLQALLNGRFDVFASDLTAIITGQNRDIARAQMAADKASSDVAFLGDSTRTQFKDLTDRAGALGNRVTRLESKADGFEQAIGALQNRTTLPRETGPGSGFGYQPPPVYRVPAPTPQLPVQTEYPGTVPSNPYVNPTLDVTGGNVAIPGGVPIGQPWVPPSPYVPGTAIPGGTPIGTSIGRN